jgi:membrane fusion protein, multidrug efflux system
MTTKCCAYAKVPRIVMIAIGVGYLAAGCSRQTSAPAEVVRPVKTVVVAAGETSRARSFPGRVEASNRVELAFQVPGLLIKLPVKEGQKVAKGEVIAELRPDEFQARLTALQGQLDQARAALAALRAGERPEERMRREGQVRAAAATLANARTEFNRLANVIQSNPNAVARVDYDRAETAYRVAQEEHQNAVQVFEKGSIAREEEIEAKEAEVRGLEGRVVEGKIQLEDCILRAPYDGVIARRFVEQGQNVQAKQRVVRFQDVDEVEIAVDVPETVMVADIMTADVVQMVAELSGTPGIEFPVRIREVAQVADPATQTFDVRVAMEAPPGIRALPGMTAVVTVTYRRAEVLGERILVPVSAVSKQDTGEQVVWVIGPDQKVARQGVKIGSLTGGQVEILEGLKPGDRIAVAGVTFLRDGMKVRDLGDALGGGPS